MKKLALSLCLSLSLWSQAHAALSVVTGPQQNGNPPPGLTLTGSVGSGQAIFLTEQANGCTSTTVHDNVNTGNYTLLASYGSPAYECIFWKLTNASGTPTITITGTANYTSASAAAVIGFTGTPTVDAALTGLTSTGTGTTATGPTTVTNFNNEALVQSTYSATANITVSGSNWPPCVASDWSQACFLTTVATSGTTSTFTGTQSTSATYYDVQGAVYDAVSASCTHSGYTSAGAIATPNGSSGSYLGKSGAFVTPDCSSVNYWQPAVGNFGVN